MTKHTNKSKTRVDAEPRKLPRWAEEDSFVSEMCRADLLFRNAVCNAITEDEVMRLKEQAIFKT